MFGPKVSQQLYLLPGKLHCKKLAGWYKDNGRLSPVTKERHSRLVYDFSDIVAQWFLQFIFAVHKPSTVICLVETGLITIKKNSKDKMMTMATTIW